MENDQQKALLAALKSVQIPAKKSKTDFLENPSVLKIITSKMKQGATMKALHLAILNSGYKLSFAAFKGWMNAKYSKN